MGGGGDPPSLEEVSFFQLKLLREYAAKNRLQNYLEALSAWDGSGEEPVL
jgi:hypothetical protein